MAYDVMDAMVLMALHANKNISVKEFKREAFKLSKKTTPAVSKGLMASLQVGDAPVKTLFYHVNKFLDLLHCCSEISMMGHQYIGMILHDDIAYPLEIKFTAETQEEQVEDADWLLKNELLVMTRAVQDTLNKLQLDRITCSVLLFNNRGFSGTVVPFKNVGREVWT